MQLKKVYFDAYKSLLNKEMELTENCIGMVGINESGKSNILNAIRTLSDSKKLILSNTPRMGSSRSNPCIRFEFLADKEIKDVVKDKLIEWSGGMPGKGKSFVLKDVAIVYHVLFDREANSEKRFFTIEGLKIPENVFVLCTNAAIDDYLVKRGDKFVPFNECILLTDKEIVVNEKLEKIVDDLKLLANEIIKLESQIEEEEQVENLDQDSTSVEESLDDKTGVDLAHVAIRNQKLLNLRMEYEKLVKEKNNLKDQLGEFNIEECIAEIKKELESLEEAQEGVNEKKQTAKAAIKGYEKLARLNDAQNKDLVLNEKVISKLDGQYQNLENEKIVCEQQLEAASKSFREKYTDNIDVLSDRLGVVLRKTLESYLPKVVFWKYDDKYILPDKIKLDEITKASNMDELSRPLYNLFRIGFDVDGLESLKKKITEIKRDHNERAKSQALLNKKIDDFLKSVWPEYDQCIDIGLEQENVLVRFFDPKCKEEASFYNMIERSQGAKTFISFLLTVGVEAKSGVIKNTILLLDEPETHLHPSGVRFMLRELIDAANDDNGNKVLFATHSIFMIDREKFDRHLIVTKEKEHTRIKPAIKDRIGFFMQEEVLYSALDVDLNKDFNSTKLYNFVFEGDGDARLFEHFYGKMRLRASTSKNTSFYHGGKCSDIIKYLKQRPIQLGTQWFFILDSDESGNQLKDFLKSKYKKYIDKDISIYQYYKDDLKGKPVELEDLLSKEFLNEVIKESLGVVCDEVDVELFDGAGLFSDYFSKVESKYKNKGFSKSEFKEALNIQLIKKLEMIKTKEETNEHFEMYCSWVNSVIDSMRNGDKNELPNDTKKKTVPKKKNESQLDNTL